LQKEINNANIFKANFLNWETSIEQNIRAIIVLSCVGIATIFLIAGLILHIYKILWEI
jgi:hypothetical protein